MGVGRCINSHDQAYVVEFVHKEVFSLILHVHASECVVGADIGKLRKHIVIYILIDTEENLLICKTTACTAI